MRIGIDASRAFVEHPTGTERYSYEVITRMLMLPEAKNHEWILYIKRNQNYPAKASIVEIPFRYLWTQAGLAARTWRDKLDVLWIPAHTLPLLRRPGLRTVVTIHGIEYEWLPAYENRLQRWYLPLSTRYAVHSATRVIAVSEFTKKQLIERLGADGKKIRVIYEGYDCQIRNSKSEVLNKYKIKPKQYILFVGTVQPRKNLERLIEAFGRIGGSGALGLKLVIAGKPGWMYESILTAPKRYKVDDKVIFTGYIDDPTREVLLKKALVYVQPSITEGFGLPVLEAMAAGVPVVSSDGGALQEIVGEAGILFDPLDINDIGHKLALVINSQLLKKELIKKGRERVLQFGWDKAATETLRLITSDHNLIV